MVTKMDAKKLLVSLSLAVLAIFMVATVSAAPIVDGTLAVEVDGVPAAELPAVIAGESVAVVIEFTSAVDATEVEVELELGDSEVVSKPFDVEAGHTYRKALKIDVPFELKDEVSDDLELEIRIGNDDDESNYENNEFVLRVQRPSFNPEIKSITVSQSVDAGESFPVDLVLKNMGYNDLDDIYITVAISELGVYKTAYFGDLVPLEVCDDDDDCDEDDTDTISRTMLGKLGVCDDDDDCDEDDTVSGRLFLEVPYGVDAGAYTLEVTVENDDVVLKATKALKINNEFSENVVVVSSSRTASVGEDAEYTLLLVNPTNNIKMFTIVTESNDQVSSEVVGQSVVVVQAGSSETVTVKANAEEAGTYNFDVSVLSGNAVEGTATLTLNAEEKTTANPIIVLTVILAIIFLVLLVVLIVLLGKKPAKTEEFGESYY